MRWGRRILGWMWVASVAASTLLFVALAAYGVRSFWVHDIRQVGFQWYPTQDDYSSMWIGLGSQDGGVRFEVVRNDFDLTHAESMVSDGDRLSFRDLFRSQNAQTFRGRNYAIPVTDFDWQVGMVCPSFEHEAGARAGRHDESWTLWVPSIYSLPLLFVLPLIAIRRWRKKRRIAREGLCFVCGYDLRASAERCPECGTAIEVKHAIT